MFYKYFYEFRSKFRGDNFLTPPYQSGALCIIALHEWRGWLIIDVWAQHIYKVARHCGQENLRLSILSSNSSSSRWQRKGWRNLGLHSWNLKSLLLWLLESVEDLHFRFDIQIILVLEWFISAYISWHFSTFSPFLSLHRTAWQPYRCTLHQFILKTKGRIPEICTKKKLKIGEVEKLSFFEWPLFDLFFKKNFLVHHSLVKIYRLAWMGLNFDNYPGFQLKKIQAN